MSDLPAMDMLGHVRRINVTNCGSWATLDRVSYQFERISIATTGVLQEGPAPGR